MNKQSGEIPKTNSLLRTWAASLIIAGALVCTLSAKLYWLIHIKKPFQWPDCVKTDILVLVAAELLIMLACFLWPKRNTVRIMTFLAAIICAWSVINAGWLIATGTQVLPQVLAPLFYDPLGRFSIISRHLTMRPFAAVALLLPSAIALAFFFYIMTKPVVPSITEKHIRVRIVIFALLAVSALLFALITKIIAAETSSLAELRYNSQLKAVQSLFYRNTPKKISVEKKAIEPQLPPNRPEEVLLPYKKNIDRYNIVIVVLESVSPPLTDLFNAGDVKVPFLKSLAKKGTAFTNCHTVATHTTKALFAIHTGKYPSASQDYAEAALANYPYQSIASILKSTGSYRTAFFQSAAGYFEARPGLVYNLGFDKFFAREDIADTNSYLGYIAADEFTLIAPVTEWIKQSQAPFLLTVLGSATHDPYEIPKWFLKDKKTDLKNPKQRYKVLLEYTDSFLEKLYGEIRRAAKGRDLIFCVVGDHGEAFGQHGMYGHARIPYEEATKVFWIITGGKVKHGKKLNLPVGNIDVTPTLLEMLGFDIPSSAFDGANALRSFPADRRIYFSTWMNNGPTGFICDNEKFIYDPTNKLAVSFDLAKDPSEKTGLFLKGSKFQDAQENILQIRNWQSNSLTALRRDNVEKYQRIFDNWLCQTNSREPRAVYNKR